MLSDERATLRRTGWLHFYQMRHLSLNTYMPQLIIRGKGIHVFDDSGKSYIDGLSGAFCVNVGYGRDSILRESYRAASSIHFISPFLATHPSTVHLSCRLSQLASPILGPDARVFFVNSGSEAVEAAIKLVRAYSLRTGQGNGDIISRTHSYHGTTIGALSVSGLEMMRRDFGPLLDGFIKIPYPNCSRCEISGHHPQCSLACLAALEMRSEQGIPSAVIIETIQTSGGIILPPDGYLQRIQSFCQHSGALLIVDEVITGFGRIGQWFSSEEFSLNPDILVCAKGLTSGYESLGAIIVKKSIADIFDGESDEAWFAHGATFGGRPAATAASLENLRILEAEGLLENAKIQGDYLIKLLNSHFKDVANIGDIYGRGLLIAVDLLDDNGQLADVGDSRHIDLTEHLFENGVILRMFNSRRAPLLQVAPPLCINQAECDMLADIIKKSVVQTFIK